MTTLLVRMQTIRPKQITLTTTQSLGYTDRAHASDLMCGIIFSKDDPPNTSHIRASTGMTFACAIPLEINADHD